eukprot:795924-Prymnesium_polylepis.1
MLGKSCERLAADSPHCLRARPAPAPGRRPTRKAAKTASYHQDKTRIITRKSRVRKMENYIPSHM